jgi:competence protein ComEA
MSGLSSRSETRAAPGHAAFRPRRSASGLGERRAAGLLTLLALGCGGWALYPELSAAPRVPTVSHIALPPARTVAAPEYASTPSIRPLISGKLNLNTATETQLEALPGIGPAFAARLQAARPYHSLADLDAVPGVGPKMLAKLTPLVRF